MSKRLFAGLTAALVLGPATAVTAQSGPAYLRPPLERFYGFCSAGEPDARRYVAVSSIFSVPGRADVEQVATRFEAFAETTLGKAFADPECRLFFGDADTADGGRRFSLDDLRVTGREILELPWSDPEEQP